MNSLFTIPRSLDKMQRATKLPYRMGKHLHCKKTPDFLVVYILESLSYVIQYHLYVYIKIVVMASSIAPLFPYCGCGVLFVYLCSPISCVDFCPHVLVFPHIERSSYFPPSPIAILLMLFLLLLTCATFPFARDSIQTVMTSFTLQCQVLPMKSNS